MLNMTHMKLEEYWFHNLIPNDMEYKIIIN